MKYLIILALLLLAGCTQQPQQSQHDVLVYRMHYPHNAPRYAPYKLPKHGDNLKYKYVLK